MGRTRCGARQWIIPTATCKLIKLSVSHEAWYWYATLRKHDAAERLEVKPVVTRGDSRCLKYATMHALLPREKKAVVEELGAIT